MTKGRVKDNSAGVGLEVVISISINGILVGIRILLANCGVFGGERPYNASSPRVVEVIVGCFGFAVFENTKLNKRAKQ
jgi:hypothetical protein